MNHRAECYCFRRHLLTFRDFVEPYIIISELMSGDCRREMPWEYCWWSSKSGLRSIKRLGSWRWQFRNNEMRCAFVRFVACRSLGTSYQTRYSQNSGVRTSSVNSHCELHREVCCVHRKKCSPYVPGSLLRWAWSIPAKIRNTNQKILVGVVLAIPQLQTAQITKIQQLSFMKPRCNSGFGFPSCWVGGR